MTVGILKVSLFIPQSNSLKAKRMVLHSIKAQLRNRFNVALAQIDDEDKWQKATLAIAGVERDKRHMESVLSEVINFISEIQSAQLIEHQIELL